jgi:predicted membrane protein
VGGVLLMRQTGYAFPDWLFTWEALLITVGIFVGIHNGFKDLSWLVMILVGLVFLSDNIWPNIQMKQYVIPIAIIAVGLVFILSPKRRHCRHRGWFRKNNNLFGEAPGFESTPSASGDLEPTHETIIDLVSVFAGIKKRVLSKQFKGGDITCVFGGAEVNLTHADFVSPVVLDVTMIFGGTKLIIPANWEVRPEVTAIFGGVDDKRPQPTSGVPEKTLILKGTLMFGGIEVNSFPL